MARLVPVASADPYDRFAVEHEGKVATFHTRDALDRFLDRHGLTLDDDGEG